MAFPPKTGLICISIMIEIILAGCDSAQPDSRPLSVMEVEVFNVSHIVEAADRMRQNNPCGYLLVQPPFFNISGQVRGRTDPDTIVYLYIVRNLSFEAAEYTVGRCPTISRATVSKGRDFLFNSLPTGKYMLLIKHGQADMAPGVPILHEFRQANYSLRVSMSRNISGRSATLFSITGVDQERKPQ